MAKNKAKVGVVGYGVIGKRVADAVDVPLIVWGTSNHEKDIEVLRRVAEICQGKNLIIGPVEDGDHKKIGAQAIAYKHTVIASTPIDINLAKQLNILLGSLGVPDEQIIMDPTVSGVGYGIEYTYSVMERMRMAGLAQQDDRLQFPIIWLKRCGRPRRRTSPLKKPQRLAMLKRGASCWRQYQRWCCSWPVVM